MSNNNENTVITSMMSRIDAQIQLSTVKGDIKMDSWSPEAQIISFVFFGFIVSLCVVCCILNVIYEIEGDEHGGSQVYNSNDAYVNYNRNYPPYGEQDEEERMIQQAIRESQLNMRNRPQYQTEP